MSHCAQQSWWHIPLAASVRVQMEKMLFLWRVSLSNLQIMQMSLAGAKVWTYCTGCNCLMLCVCVCTTGIPHIFSPYTQSHYKNTLHGQSCTDAPGHIPYFCELVQGWRNKCPFNLFQNCCKGHSLLEGNSTRGKGSYIPSWMGDHWCTYMEVNVVTKKNKKQTHITSYNCAYVSVCYIMGHNQMYHVFMPD